MSVRDERLFSSDRPDAVGDEEEMQNPEDFERTVRRLEEENARLRRALPLPPYLPLPEMEDWTDRLPSSPSEEYAHRPLGDIRRIVIHHSALPADIGPEEIAGYQVYQRGWPGIGYHFFITAAGAIIQTNPLETVCFHSSVGNATSVGVCLAGRFVERALPAEAQLDAAAVLCAHLCGRFSLHAELGDVVGHGELVEVECPGEEWAAGREWRQDLLTRIHARQEDARRRLTRPIGHYLLFWSDGGACDLEAWQAAAPYVERFRPVCGFSLEAAAQAEFVTIVGDEAKFSPAVEVHLRAAGCYVERIQAADAEGLRTFFRRLAESDQRFLTRSL